MTQTTFLSDTNNLVEIETELKDMHRAYPKLISLIKKDSLIVNFRMEVMLAIINNNKMNSKKLFILKRINMSKKKQTNPDEAPVANEQAKKTEAPPPLFEPMTGQEFRFIRKYYGLTQPEMTAPMGVHHRNSIGVIEKMIALDSANIIRFEKFVNARFGKGQWEKVRAIYSHTPRKQREEMIKGIRAPRKEYRHKETTEEYFSII